MKLFNCKYVIFLIVLNIFSNAQAATFIDFLPPDTVRRLIDGFWGARGNTCVAETAKVGDVITSAAGNKLKIISLSGKSSICKAPEFPIRCEVDYTFTFKTKAGIELSDDYESKSLTDFQRWGGELVNAVSKSRRNKGVVIASREKKPNIDPQIIASELEKIQINRLAEGHSKNAEQFIFDGLNAWRFEVHGKLKGLFGSSMVYLITIIEGETEILVINSYTSESNFEKEKAEMYKIINGLTRIKNEDRSVINNETSVQLQSQTTNKLEVVQSQNKPLNNDNLTNQPNSQTNQNNSPQIFKDESLTVANKLLAISKLLKDGIITEEEYNLKRAEIIKNF